MYTQNQLTEIMLDVANRMENAGLHIDFTHVKPQVEFCRKEKAYAACYRKNGMFTIKVSKYALNIDETAMRNTICHELIHTLPNCFNHGVNFKRCADIVNRKCGVCVLTKGCLNENGEQAKMERPTPKYVVTCKCCGHKYFHTRKCTAVAYPELYSCGHCGGKLESSYNRYEQ